MDFYWILWASPAQLRYSSSLGFMGLPSTPYFLCFHYFGPAAAHSHFSTSYTSHGLLFLSFRAPLSPFTSSRPICLSHGHVIHYSRRLGIMSFLLNLLTLFFPYCWASSCYWAPLPKWVSTLPSFKGFSMMMMCASFFSSSFPCLFLHLLLGNFLWSWTSTMVLISLCLQQFVYLFLHVFAVARTHFFAFGGQILSLFFFASVEYVNTFCCNTCTYFSALMQLLLCFC